MERPAFVPANTIPAGSLAPDPKAWIEPSLMTDGRAALRWWWIGEADQLMVLNQACEDGLWEGHRFVELCAFDLLRLLDLADVPAGWRKMVIPLLLRCDVFDAMTKLRLAARWAEAKA